MKKNIANLLDYQKNPALFVMVYWYVMTDKVVRSLLFKDYQPKRIYF
jgi:hypothetical protein